MEYVIGVGLAAVVCVFDSLVDFDRERVFYPAVAMVVATYYILFAVMGDSNSALIRESVIAVVFFLLAVTGFKKNLWLAVAALAAHGIQDMFHHAIVRNPGVPAWWPGFCMAFDVFAAGYLAVLLLRRSGFARHAA